MLICERKGGARSVCAKAACTMTRPPVGALASPLLARVLDQVAFAGKRRQRFLVTERETFGSHRQPAVVLRPVVVRREGSNPPDTFLNLPFEVLSQTATGRGEKMLVRTRSTS